MILIRKTQSEHLTPRKSYSKSGAQNNWSLSKSTQINICHLTFSITFTKKNFGELLESVSLFENNSELRLHSGLNTRSNSGH